MDATNVEQAFRTLIVDIYRHWAARMDSMKDETNISLPTHPPQTLHPGYQTTNTANSNSCCGSFT